MNILGIIAEFNPLHTGHAYLIEKLRKETDADFCVVVMSGDYVQRGEPAFFTKELRTKAALLVGADLVLELPVSVSTGSAEFFAEGAVSLLDKLGCITHLGFGSEHGEISAFEQAGALLCQESDAFSCALQKLLQSGMSFPKARYEALSEVLMEKNTEQASEVLSLLSSPNNILGTEYLKALKKRSSSIQPVTIKRMGASYHDIMSVSEENGSLLTFDERRMAIMNEVHDIITTTDTEQEYASASGLREQFLDAPLSPNTAKLIEKYVPQPCRTLYQDALKSKNHLTADALSLPLFYMLLYTAKEELTNFQDVTPDLAGRILNCSKDSVTFTVLCQHIKTKNLTFTRISRALLHILLQLSKDSVQAQKEADFCQYARILGFRKASDPLLTEIKKSASVPLVSKLADARTLLSPLALSQLKETVSASELYRRALLQSSVSPLSIKNEYEKSIIRI